MSQQGDVRLFHTIDGGDISVAGGLIAMDGGLETAVYLSLFGGNHDDPGGDDARRSWWGNLGEPVAARRARGEIQGLLQHLPVTAGNLVRLKAAAVRDLAWLTREKVASAVDVSVRSEGLNRVNFQVTISAEGREADFTFSANWGAQG